MFVASRSRAKAQSPHVTHRATDVSAAPPTLTRRASEQERAVDGEPDQGEHDHEDPVEGYNRLASRPLA
eukprot:12002359-Alexandrium_andersonii.AAC.1